MSWYTGRFSAAFLNLISKSIPNSGGIKRKTTTKLLDGFMDRGLELWNNKDITITLTPPGTVTTIVGRDIWGKNLGKPT